jgi:hypothetical protein
MGVKRILFIEDGDLTNQKDKLRRNLKNKGHSLVEKTINPLNRSFLKSDKEHIIDFEALKSELNKYFDEPFDLIACDYSYSGDPLDGLEVIKWVKNVSNADKKRLRRAKFVLYSSEREKLVEKTKTAEDLKKIIHLRLDGFLKRETLANELAKVILKADLKFSFSEKLLKELEKYPDFKFKSVYPMFKGKSVIEIADEIDREQHHGIGFQKNLIELCIAHLIELNSEQE